jgi:hypothetical protein
MAASKTTARKPAARKRPSGVKSESATEAKQNRGQTARIERLEAAVSALALGNATSAQDIMDTHL